MQQQQQNHSEIINDVSHSPSFNCYFSDNVIATAAIKVSSDIIHQDEFEFFPATNDEIDHLVVEEVDHKVSGVFCFRRPKKTDFVSSNLTKCNKSSSTGTGLRKWRIKNLLKRSNSEGNEPVFFLWFKKSGTKVSKQNRKVHSEEMAGKLKTTSFHEVFYVQKREEQKGEKMKSFLPYKQDLLARAFC